MNNLYKLRYFHHFTVLTFNADCPLYILKPAIVSILSKRPNIQVYIEVEDSNTKIIERLRKYEFEEGDQFLHIYRNNWIGFAVTPKTLEDWIIPTRTIPGNYRTYPYGSVSTSEIKDNCHTWDFVTC